VPLRLFFVDNQQTRRATTFKNQI